MNKKLKGIALISLMAVITVCGGCGEKTGRIPSKNEVKSKVNMAVEKEKYSYDRCEDEESEVPTKVYYFKSDERDMEFTAVATRTQGWLNGPAENYYEPNIIVNYDEGVKAYYYDHIVEVLSKSDLYDSEEKAFVIVDKNEIDEIADLLVEANEIYAQEEQYNTTSWMEDHPALMVRIDMEVEGEHYSGLVSEITGTKGKDEVMEDISLALGSIEKLM